MAVLPPGPASPISPCPSPDGRHTTTDHDGSHNTAKPTTRRRRTRRPVARAQSLPDAETHPPDTSYALTVEVDLPPAQRIILDLLAARQPGKTICPSEAARALAGDDDFRPLMPVVRNAARALVDAGRIEVTQDGRPVGLDDARGPIRLRTVNP